MASEQDNNKFSQYSYSLMSTNIKNNSTHFVKFKNQIPLHNLQNLKLSQMSGINILSQSSNETNEWREMEENKDKTFHSNIDNNLVVTENNNIIPETPELSLRSNSLYFTQNLYELINLQDVSGLRNIIRSLPRGSTYSSEPEISECSTTLQSDSEKTISGVDININYSERFENLNQSLQDFQKLSLDEHNTTTSNNIAFVENKPVHYKVLSYKQEDRICSTTQDNLQSSILDSNSSTNLMFFKQNRNLQADSDLTLSELNIPDFNKVNYSDLNFNKSYINDEITPIINTVSTKQIFYLFELIIMALNRHYNLI
jgi:hypothetical protein